MKDNFKFRCWNETNNCWQKRFLIHNCMGQTELKVFKQYDWVQDEKQSGYKLTLEQCTGLKDKNGKLIYEGDIMEHRIYLGNPELYVVKWSEPLNGWVYQEVKNSLKTSYILTEFTDSIIGNIHENPELLKEEE